MMNFKYNVYIYCVHQPKMSLYVYIFRAWSTICISITCINSICKKRQLYYRSSFFLFHVASEWFMEWLLWVPRPPLCALTMTIHIAWHIYTTYVCPCIYKYNALFHTGAPFCLLIFPHVIRSRKTNSDGSQHFEIVKRFFNCTYIHIHVHRCIHYIHTYTYIYCIYTRRQIYIYTRTQYIGRHSVKTAFTTHSGLHTRWAQ